VARGHAVDDSLLDVGCLLMGGAGDMLRTTWRSCKSCCCCGHSQHEQRVMQACGHSRTAKRGHGISSADRSNPNKVATPQRPGTCGAAMLWDLTQPVACALILLLRSKLLLHP
jgi:hypothetical protein